MSVTILDGEMEQEISEIEEGQEFQVAVELSGVYPTPQTLIVTADVNFNGEIEPNERYTVEGILDTADTLEAYGFGFLAPDDGIWPGNGTPSDPIEVNVYFAGDEQQASLTVNNVPPRITSRPSMAYETDDDGNSIVVLTAVFYDPGIHDIHSATLTWADGTTSKSLETAETNTCPTGHSKAISFSKVIDPYLELLPLTISVMDDDKGTTSYTMSELHVVRNDDDDDQSDVADMMEAPVSGDDDLKSLDLSELFYVGADVAQGKHVLMYDLGTIRIWDSADKQNLILPYLDFAGGPSGIEDVSTIQYSGQRQVFVEGIAVGTSLITLDWVSQSDLEEWQGDACDYKTIAFSQGSVEVAVWGIDLDIDSDNNDGLDPPQRDQDEEFLEENIFGIGKMIFTDDEPFVPVILEFPAGLDLSDPTISVHLEHQIFSGSSGGVQVWNTRHDDPNRTEANKLNYGSYSLAELGYDGSGPITLYLEEEFWTRSNKSKADVDRNGKPDDRLIVRLNVHGLEVVDTVKWMVVGPRRQFLPGSDGLESAPTFYPTLQYRRALRSAGAAEAVYGPNSSVDFGMKLLSQEEIESLLEGKLSEREVGEIVANLGGDWDPSIDEPPVQGLSIGLYLDHVSLDYVLSFRGTDFPELDDWVANIQNNLTGHSAQYSRAMRMAYLLGKSGINFRNTGHSLGGGLATAASMVSGKFADTFNAAGLNPNTLYRNDVWASDPDIPWYPATNLYVLWQDFLISAYKVWEVRPGHYFPDLEDFPDADVEDARDILSYLQEMGSLYTNQFGHPFAFEAWGRHIPIEGLYNLKEHEVSAIELIAGAVEQYFINDPSMSAWYSFLAGVVQGELIEKMTASHSFPSIYYGLLHNLDGWNAYDNHFHSY